MVTRRIYTALLGFAAVALASVSSAWAATPWFTIVNPSATTFPTTVDGQSSAVQTIQVTTTTAITVASFAIAPSVNGHQEFALGTSSCATGVSLPSGTTCSLPVTFSPTYSGLRTGTLAITSSTGVVFSVGLQGIANGPQGILSPGYLSTIGGTGGGTYYSGDGGPVSAARFSSPYNIAVDAQNNLYIADEVSGNVRVIYEGGAELACLIEVEEPTLFGLSVGATSCAGATSAPVAGDVYTLGGDPTPYTSSTSTHLKGSDDNRIATTITSTTSTLNSPAGIAVDPYGNVVIGDYNAYKMRVIYTGGQAMACLIEIENPTLFGLSTGATSCANATSAPIFGYIYTLLGGTGVSTPGATGDGGLANSATMTYAAAAAISPAGDIYIIDDSTQSARTSRIRVIYNGGAAAATLITTENPTVTAPVVGDVYKLAGGIFASNGDGGLASSAGILYSRGLVLDTDGDLIFTDESTTSGSQTAKVRVVWGGGSRIGSLITTENPGTTPKLGYIYTVGGDPTSGATGVGYSGDGGLATSGLMATAYSLTIDPSDNIYVSDYGNYVIRKIGIADGKITTFGGTHAQGAAAGNAITTATLWDPYGMAWGAGGTLFFTDPGDYRVRSDTNSAAPITFTVSAPVGNASETEVVYETNTGTTSLTITGIVASTNFGVEPSGSTVYSDCTTTTVLAPGATCAIGVAMVPTIGGTLTGTLTVYDNSLNITGNSQAVSLTGTSAIQTQTTVTTSNANADLGTNLTFISTTIITSGQNTTGAAPLTGNVTFTAGTITLGTAPINATGVATISYSTLPAGTYTVKAAFVPTATGYANSTGSVAQVVVAPAFTATTTVQGVAVDTGKSVAVPFTLSAVGGYAGVITQTCTGLPFDVTCTFAPSTVTFTGDSTSSVTLTIGTRGTQGMLSIHREAATFAGIFAAAILLLLPRRRRFAAVLGILLLAASMGVVGCSNAAPTAARGTFNVNATFSDGTTTIVVPVTVSVLSANQ